MILGSEPKPTSQGPSETCDHVFRGEANEEIQVLQGSEFDVMGMYDNALAHGDKYATCHFKINPKKNISYDEMMQTVSMMAMEFGFSVDECTIVKHKKPKAGEPDANEHYHVYAPWRTENGKCINSSFSRVKQEKISRVSEYLFGHDIVKGKHQVAVIKQLRDEGKTDIADYIEEHTPNLYEAVQSAFTSTQHQMAQRQGINLGQLKNSIKELRISSESFKDMIDGLDGLGVAIKKGDKPDTYIIVNNENDKFLGSANRLFGMKKADFKHQYEALQAGQDTKFEPLEAIIAPIASDEKAPLQKPVEAPIEPDRENVPSKSATAPQPQKSGHWLSGINLTSPASTEAHHAVATDAMSYAEKIAISDYNKRESQNKNELDKYLSDQKKFAELLIKIEQELSELMRKRYQALPREPFANPELRDSHYISQSLHDILDPLRSSYLKKKSRWLSSAKSELRAFNEKMKELRFKEFTGLDIYNNQKDYDYVINNMSDLYVSSRQKRHDEWSNNLDVINYVNHKNNIDNLISYIKEHKDEEILQLAIKSPLLAIDRIKMNKEENNKTNISNTAISNKLSI
nr:hypothetical protein [Acetobacter persici]